MLRAFIACLAILCAPSGLCERIWQPIIDYTISFPGDRPDAAPTINPFENFTYFASDFGWMGPGESRLDSKGGIIRVKPKGQWTGAWHSLAGLASQKNRTIDPRDLIGLGGPPEKLCGVRDISINASGNGPLRIELADAERKVIWSATFRLDSKTTVARSFAIEPEISNRIKFMNWIAEPDSEIQISSIGFLVERPKMTPEEWAFRISLGKLRRCHDPASGLTRDRGHLPPGEFDSISSTGMHALASALAAAEGIIERDLVVDEIKNTVAAISSLPNAHGFLPHFIHRDPSGKLNIHPGTEYSTVDTAIALHSLLLAAEIMKMPEITTKISAMISKTNFDAVTDADSWIGHGFQDDRKTLLESKWSDWGGETALVLALESMVSDRQPRGKMCTTGEVYRGIGFIAEIQSLFYPDFDQTDPDLVSGISWPEARKKLLKRQMTYLTTNWPDTPAAKQGIFGLSAGESGMPGSGYSANGTEVMSVRWLHPHYMFMGLALTAPKLYAKGLQDLNSATLLYPLGLPENIELGLNLHNPMQGSLNASLETLSAYHGWKKRQTPENLLDRASLSSPLLRKAASRFYKSAN